MNEEEPESPLTRAALIMLLGGGFVGVSHGNWVGRGGATSQALLAGGCLLIAGAVLATLRALYRHWKDRDG